uniref:Uncharacterized protein n=1 Tax=Chromera velia CCMP2878 TaxID=1169474 RepID=A0A0G4GAU7_9ALVE|eukprot:Cvel_21069.t1-p1 / transcript=Cvel_21069.t1 / gene=Cvel_21069 / organism=Chromera_velia_CCMP2878 / gene_product=hypothetical protein / transcript_product=hypothetical protein / location=Cvel_scaffold1947:21708-23180(-) / protein_length=491 / sequence_SO=supercontig / SO=protein_coding / is_pseudo=false
METLTNCRSVASRLRAAAPLALSDLGVCAVVVGILGFLLSFLCTLSWFQLLCLSFVVGGSGAFLLDLVLTTLTEGVHTLVPKEWDKTVRSRCLFDLFYYWWNDLRLYFYINRIILIASLKPKGRDLEDLLRGMDEEVVRALYTRGLVRLLPEWVQSLYFGPEAEETKGLGALPPSPSGQAILTQGEDQGGVLAGALEGTSGRTEVPVPSRREPAEAALHAHARPETSAELQQDEPSRGECLEEGGVLECVREDYPEIEYPVGADLAAVVFRTHFSPLFASLDSWRLHVSRICLFGSFGLAMTALLTGTPRGRQMGGAALGSVSRLLQPLWSHMLPLPFNWWALAAGGGSGILAVAAFRLQPAASGSESIVLAEKGKRRESDKRGEEGESRGRPGQCVVALRSSDLTACLGPLRSMERAVRGLDGVHAGEGEGEGEEDSTDAAPRTPTPPHGDRTQIEISDEGEAEGGEGGDVEEKIKGLRRRTALPSAESS